MCMHAYMRLISSRDALRLTRLSSALTSVAVAVIGVIDVAVAVAMPRIQ
jgi:hypothetical protein